MEHRAWRRFFRAHSAILHPPSSILVFITFSCILILTSGGCTVVGVLAAKTIPVTEKPRYVGLQDQTVGVMVWADRAVRIDWDRIQLDVANATQNALQATKAKEIKGATFPVQPASIVRFQLDHPELEAAPVTDFAAQLGVTRLIYIEMERFSTRSDLSYQMFRGTAVATLKVVEIDPATGQARIAYEENGITAVFPRKGPSEGEIVGTDAAFYVGTIRALAVELAHKLVTHEVE